LAMAINITSAALAGTLLPVLLRAMSIDPALAGSVILTTITDIVGFVSFLGLATWLLT
jgi:magnesium transporter